MNKTLLAIGDGKDWDSYLKFYRQGRLLKAAGCALATADYDAVLRGDLPDIASPTVIIFLFFPFVYWDRHIEPKSYPGVYGNRRFHAEFKRLWKTVGRQLRRRYGDKTLHFINAPEIIPPERDKQLTKEILAAAGVPTPQTYRTTSPRTVLRLLRDGKALFIKVRYGSMGKGITYLNRDTWYTNFGFRQGRIVNRHSDYGWKFRDVTGNEAFLAQLLAQDVVVEEAIPRWLIGGRQFDLRLLIFFDKILYMYPRTNAAQNVTTNVSQGAESRTMSFLKGVDSRVIDAARATGRRAAGALGLNFAGVDLVLDPRKRRPVVIEVNSFPGFPKMRTLNLARHLIAEIDRRKWK